MNKIGKVTNKNDMISHETEQLVTTNLSDVGKCCRGIDLM